MRKFIKEYRIQADSVPEIARGLEDAATRLDREGVKFDGRKLRPGPLLNALTWQFLALAEADRALYAERALASLEGMLAEDAPERESAARRLASASGPDVGAGRTAQGAAGGDRAEAG